MRKIDLADYQTAGGNTFAVRSSLAAILFNEEKLDPREVIRRDELARQIETNDSEEFWVEEADYDKIVRGLNATDLKPLGRDVVPFVKRVLDAPKVSTAVAASQ